MLFVESSIELITEFDLCDQHKYTLLPNNIDYILHLAGQSSGEISFDNPIADLNKNTTSTLNLIAYAEAARCLKFLYASSMSVYGANNTLLHEDLPLNPLSCYGVSKLASENYLRIFSSRLAPFRCVCLLWPNQIL